jgi:fimbrial chaperone protein
MNVLSSLVRLLAAPVAALAVVGVLVQETHGQASLMIWPIDPVIQVRDRAAALWLENRGASAVSLQIRVLAWTVSDFKEAMIDQRDQVIASPPVATIEPGRRQLVRLTKTAAPPDAKEMAYRVVVDEIPALPAEDVAGEASAGESSLGLQFRMRYSLPLFIYGRGVMPSGDRPLSAPVLSWKRVVAGEREWLQVRNSGSVHARLTHVRLQHGSQTFEVANGLLGYVLSGAEMRWPLAAGAPSDPDVELRALVSGRNEVVQRY